MKRLNHGFGLRLQVLRSRVVVGFRIDIGLWVWFRASWRHLVRFRVPVMALTPRFSAAILVALNPGPSSSHEALAPVGVGCKPSNV